MRAAVSMTLPDPFRQHPHIVRAWLWSTLMGGKPPSTTTITGYDAQKLLPCDLRCTICMKTFDAPFHYHEIREYWIDRPDVCESCRPIRDAAIANMFDPAVLRSVMEGKPDWSFGDEVIDFDAVPSRRLAPFVMPMDPKVSFRSRYRKD